MHDTIHNKERIKRIGEEMKTLMNKLLNKVQDTFTKLKDKLTNIENKRMAVLTVSVWAAVFLVIVVACKINNSVHAASNAKAEKVVKAEVESTSKTIKTTVKETTRKREETTTTEEETTTAMEETTTTAEETTTEQETVQQQYVERETIPIQNIQVSAVDLKDDVQQIVKEPEVVFATNIKTQSSQNMDIEQFADCIDVSKHQGTIDWAKVKAAGINYAFIRVGYRGYETGALAKDKTCDRNIQQALANGVQVGVYFFSQAMTEQEALEEASLTLEYIKNYNITLPVVIDWETGKDETGMEYRTYTGTTKAELTNIISTFCDTVKSHGYEPMVYMCKSDFQNRVYASTLAAKYKIWLAWYFDKYNTTNYTSNRFTYGDELPEMSFRYDVWQYSSKGRIDGISELVDMNVMVFPQNRKDIKLTASKSSFVTNLYAGGVNYMEGVSATDSFGKDAVSKVTYVIKNSNGTIVTEQEAVSASGKYSVVYSLKDNGQSVSRTATLYVRDIPKIYFDKEVWGDNDSRVVTYEYDNQLSVNENYNKIVNLMNTKIESVYFDLIEDVGTSKVIKNKALCGIENIVVDNDIQPGEYTMIYLADDGKGLSNSRTVVLRISRQPIEENTETEENASTAEMADTE